MNTRIWEKCNCAQQIQQISVQPYRAQIFNQMATRSLVDSVEEETILEQMLGRTSLNLGESLLREKFEGRNSSRFGSNFEPTIWYGSLNKITTLAERAFLTFRYLFDNEHIVSINAPGQDILIFSANVATPQGVELHRPPFDEFENMISSPISYESSRPLGTAMRNDDVMAFTYVSARDLSDPKGINVGVFSMDAFVDQSPKSYEFWKCIANNSEVEFFNQNPHEDERIIFEIDDFLVGGVLPRLN